MAEPINTFERLKLRNDSYQSLPKPNPGESFAITLRKQKRLEATVQKRRFLSTNQPPPSQIFPSSASRETIQHLLSHLSIFSEQSQLLSALSTLRMVYSLEDIQSFKLAMDLKLIPALIKLLSFKELNINCLKELLWCFCNLASGPSFICESLMAHKLDESVAKLIQSEDKEIAQASVWCLSNLACDNQSNRNKIYSLGIIEILINICRVSECMIDTIIWTFRNLLEGKALITNPQILDILKLIKKVLKLRNKSSYIEALWSVSYISDGDANSVHCIISSKVLDLIIKAVESDKIQISLPALRTIGNISAGTNDQVEILLNKGILDILYPIIERPVSSKLKRYGLWTLSNLTSGTKSQIHSVVQHPIFIQAIVSINNSDACIKKEAICIANNISKLGSEQSILGLINVGVVKECKELFENCNDPSLIYGSLECIVRILQVLEESRFRYEVIALIRQNELVEILERSGMENNKKIKKLLEKVLRLLEDTNTDNFVFS